MQFINKEDDLALSAGHLFQHGLQAFLEFAAILSTCNQRTEIKGDHLLVFQGLGYITTYDALGQALDNGGFSYASLATNDQVILCTAAQEPYGARHLPAVCVGEGKCAAHCHHRPVASAQVRR